MPPRVRKVVTLWMLVVLMMPRVESADNLPLYNGNSQCGLINPVEDDVDIILSAGNTSYVFCNDYLFCLSAIRSNGLVDFMESSQCSQLVQALHACSIPLKTSFVFTLGVGLIYRDSHGNAVKHTQFKFALSASFQPFASDRHFQALSKAVGTVFNDSHVLQFVQPQANSYPSILSVKKRKDRQVLGVYVHTASDDYELESETKLPETKIPIPLSAIHCFHCGYGRASRALFVSGSEGLAWFGKLTIKPGSIEYAQSSPYFPSNRLLGCRTSLCLFPAIDSMIFIQSRFIVISGRWHWSYKLGDEYATPITHKGGSGVNKLWHDPLHQKVLGIALPRLDVYEVNVLEGVITFNKMFMLNDTIEISDSFKAESLIDLHSQENELFVFMPGYVIIFRVFNKRYRRHKSFRLAVPFQTVMSEPYTNRTMFIYHDFLIYSEPDMALESVDVTQLRVGMVVDFLNCDNFYWQTHSTVKLGLDSIKKYRKHVQGLQPYKKKVKQLTSRTFRIGSDLKIIPFWQKISWSLLIIAVVSLPIFLALVCYRKRKRIKKTIGRFKNFVKKGVKGTKAGSERGKKPKAENRPSKKSTKSSRSKSRSKCKSKTKSKTSGSTKTVRSKTSKATTSKTKSKPKSKSKPKPKSKAPKKSKATTKSRPKSKAKPPKSQNKPARFASKAPKRKR